MQDLSALTPPLLMCAVVVFAVVAFLRHEMRPSRADPGDQDDNISPVPAQAADGDDNERAAETDGADVSATDG